MVAPATLYLRGIHRAHPPAEGVSGWIGAMSRLQEGQGRRGKPSSVPGLSLRSVTPFVSPVLRKYRLVASAGNRRLLLLVSKAALSCFCRASLFPSQSLSPSSVTRPSPFFFPASGKKDLAQPVRKHARIPHSCPPPPARKWAGGPGVQAGTGKRGKGTRLVRE